MCAIDRDPVIRILHATKMFTPAELDLATEQIDIYLNSTKQSDYSIVVLEGEDFEVKGYMSFGPASLTQYIYNLYWIAISPAAQNHGYGRELISWLEKHVKSVSSRMILTETSSKPQNRVTRAFYRALGFKEISRIPDFYGSGDDRITYVKKLKKGEPKRYGYVAENFET
jgi:ribosomal protein S18 acetylase RimI-like enzyme